MDFTGDGIVDILSGCYWSLNGTKFEGATLPVAYVPSGYIYLLAGTQDDDFSIATPVLNAEKKPLTNVPLSFEMLEKSDSEDLKRPNKCTAQFAVDYDNDGDLDLVVGEFGRQFFLHINSANNPKAAPVFADQPTVLNVNFPDGHSDPYLVDWDADGDLDLLSGSASGRVYLSVNEGSATEPKWADFQCIINHSDLLRETTDETKMLIPGYRVRICVTDFNRDGKLDLLVGDTSTVEKEVAGLSAEETARVEKEYNEEMQPLQDALDKITDKLGKEHAKNHEADKRKDDPAGDQRAIMELAKKVNEQTKDLRDEMDALREKKELFRKQELTGHVWVYLQK